MCLFISNFNNSVQKMVLVRRHMSKLSYVVIGDQSDNRWC